MAVYCPIARLLRAIRGEFADTSCSVPVWEWEPPAEVLIQREGDACDPAFSVYEPVPYSGAVYARDSSGFCKADRIVDGATAGRPLPLTAAGPELTLDE